ncbi:nad dependent epimerase [Colletotrichum truncatum]|uniref:Nad dependent epimerase n=1 Tax=Colletotrichum truncatum TaxID=5467 RepID=A0ACC3ZAW6_COLTU|nr:nad dependent epimerase [Colletotrichum truncatum]KAF6783156.1 nad dependent epimerase [Colletotrichum truncatum]
MSSDPATVLVTGANGYLALHVIEQVLKRGYNVCGTVRSKKTADKVRTKFPADYGTRATTATIEDLTKTELFRDVFQGNIVGTIHVASPVHGHVKDNVRDMLEPAIKGVTGMLDAIKTYGSLSFKRVVHTSSIGAMLDTSKDPRIGYIYNESDWNPLTFEEAASLEDRGVLYIAGKAPSPRAPWAWMEYHKPNFDLSCLNPSVVFGPHLEQVNSLEDVNSTSKIMWVQLMDAREIPSLQWAGAIDVRDAAAMLAVALDTPAAGGERFLLAQHFDWQSAADVAREVLPEDAKRRIPVGTPRTGMSDATARLYQVDGTKAVRMLGIKYRPMPETVEDILKQFLAVEGKTKI